MKQRLLTVYESFDGQSFDTEEECVAHEKKNIWWRLVGMTSASVQAALAYETDEGRELGDVLVTLGNRVYETKRRQRAGLVPVRRRKKTGPSEEVSEGQTAA